MKTNTIFWIIVAWAVLSWLKGKDNTVAVNQLQERVTALENDLYGPVN